MDNERYRVENLDSGLIDYLTRKEYRERFKTGDGFGDLIVESLKVRHVLYIKRHKITRIS